MEDCTEFIATTKVSKTICSIYKLAVRLAVINHIEHIIDSHHLLDGFGTPPWTIGGDHSQEAYATMAAVPWAAVLWPGPGC